MKSFQRTLAIGVFALGASAFAASDPAYNASSVVDVDGVITAARAEPAGSALEGTHLTVKTKTATIDVYLGPTEFLRIFKTNFPVGNEVEVVGSKVKFENNDVILAREVSVGSATITLRDAHGAPDWKNWGVEIDPSAVR
jgi:hypothetical protein